VAKDVDYIDRSLSQALVSGGNGRNDVGPRIIRGGPYAAATIARLRRANRPNSAGLAQGPTLEMVTMAGV
jgi:hypothetical protein